MAFTTMAPTKRGPKAPKSVSFSGSKSSDPPPPFKQAPEILSNFVEGLSRKHVYVTHIDSKPASFKRKMFMIPIAMNVCVAALFVWRMYHILPWYFKLFISSMGHNNETTFPIEKSTWEELGWEVGKRAATFFFDFILFAFVWPWPLEFVAGITYGNPAKWRWNVGFREKEIYVRRSRDWYDVVNDAVHDDTSKKIFTAYVNQATSPMLQEQKTGYLLMNAQWDLDWNAMVHAHAMVDKKDVALDAFKSLVLLYHEEFGWLSYDLKMSSAANEDEKRRQVFAFRDALAGMGKEKLFYRWVEVVQYEASQPGGFGPEQQEAAAKRIRELFQEEDIDFDELWKDTVGTDSMTSL